MFAVAVSVSEGVRAAIAAAQLTPEFTVERNYADWDLDLTKLDGFELKDTEKLRVDVVTHTTEQSVELASRGEISFRIPIDIAVRRRFGVDKQNQTTGRIEVEEIDKLVLLVEEIYLLLVRSEIEDAEWQELNILACPVRQHLREWRQFTGIVRVVFEASRNV